MQFYPLTPISRVQIFAGRPRALGEALPRPYDETWREPQFIRMIGYFCIRHAYLSLSPFRDSLHHRVSLICVSATSSQVHLCQCVRSFSCVCREEASKIPIPHVHYYLPVNLATIFPTAAMSFKIHLSTSVFFSCSVIEQTSAYCQCFWGFDHIASPFYDVVDRAQLCKLAI